MKVLELTDVRAPSQAEPELTCYNTAKKSIETYDLDEGLFESSGADGLPQIIRTGHMKVYSDVLRMFLENDDRRPFLICGPSGAGKTYAYSISHILSNFVVF